MEARVREYEHKTQKRMDQLLAIERKLNLLEKRYFLPNAYNSAILKEGVNDYDHLYTYGGGYFIQHLSGVGRLQWRGPEAVVCNWWDDGLTMAVIKAFLVTNL